MHELASLLDTLVLAEVETSLQRYAEELGLTVEVGPIKRKPASARAPSNSSDAATVLSWLKDD